MSLLGATPPPIASIKQLRQELRLAAELEHALLRHYLYTAATLPIQDPDPERMYLKMQWKKLLLIIARQEMSHLGMVFNLQTAFEDKPFLGRSPFPIETPYFGIYGINEISLTPFNLSTISKLVRFEAPLPERILATLSPFLSEATGSRIGQTIADIISRETTHGVSYVGPKNNQTLSQFLEANANSVNGGLFRFSPSISIPEQENLNSVLREVEQGLVQLDGNYVDISIKSQSNKRDSSIGELYARILDGARTVILSTTYQLSTEQIYFQVSSKELIGQKNHAPFDMEFYHFEQKDYKSENQFLKKLKLIIHTIVEEGEGSNSSAKKRPDWDRSHYERLQEIESHLSNWSPEFSYRSTTNDDSNKVVLMNECVNIIYNLLLTALYSRFQATNSNQRESSFYIQKVTMGAFFRPMVELLTDQSVGNSGKLKAAPSLDLFPSTSSIKEPAPTKKYSKFVADLKNLLKRLSKLDPSNKAIEAILKNADRVEIELGAWKKQ